MRQRIVVQITLNIVSLCPVLTCRGTRTEEIHKTDFPLRQFVIQHHGSVAPRSVSGYMVEIQKLGDVFRGTTSLMIICRAQLIRSQIPPFQIRLCKNTKETIKKSAFTAGDALVIVVLVVGVGKAVKPTLGKKTRRRKLTDRFILKARTKKKRI